VQRSLANQKDSGGKREGNEKFKERSETGKICTDHSSCQGLMGGGDRRYPIENPDSDLQSIMGVLTLQKTGNPQESYGRTKSERKGIRAARRIRSVSIRIKCKKNGKMDVTY